jgi:rSAM/selenodomain-associated transferase 1
MTAFPQHLLIMAKQPRIGRVKTRLGAQIGAMEATRAYRVMLGRTIRRLAADPRWHTWVAVSGVHELHASVWPHEVALLDQGQGDLGCRMQRMFDVLPHGRVVIIGSDIPDIKCADIACAFKALGASDTVFGSAPDGGYWLVGQARRLKVLNLFENVRCSSEHALADTMANLRGASASMVRQLADVDDAASYRDWVKLPYMSS